MKFARYWKIILPFAVVLGLFGLVALWLVWPSIKFGFALRQLEGDGSSGKDWTISLNTFDDEITSSAVAELYLKGSRHLSELGPNVEAYTFEDVMGYQGCITVSRYSGSYEYVRVFGANDNDSISVGRASGTFPPERFSIVKKIATNHLPKGIIRPW